jgi:hypothetical protein
MSSSCRPRAPTRRLAGPRPRPTRCSHAACSRAVYGAARRVRLLSRGAPPPPNPFRGCLLFSSVFIPAQKRPPGACFPAFISCFLPHFAKRTQLVFFPNLFIPKHFRIFQLGSFGKKPPFLESPVPTDVPSSLVGTPLRGVRSAPFVASLSSSPLFLCQTTVVILPPPQRPVQHKISIFDTRRLRL